MNQNSNHHLLHPHCLKLQLWQVLKLHMPRWHHQALSTMQTTDLQDRETQRPMCLPYMLYSKSNFHSTPYHFSVWLFLQMPYINMTHCTFHCRVTVSGLSTSSVTSLKRSMFALWSIANHTNLFSRTISAFLTIIICQTWLADRWESWLAKLRK